MFSSPKFICVIYVFSLKNDWIVINVVFLCFHHSSLSRKIPHCSVASTVGSCSVDTAQWWSFLWSTFQIRTPLDRPLQSVMCICLAFYIQSTKIFALFFFLPPPYSHYSRWSPENSCTEYFRYINLSIRWLTLVCRLILPCFSRLLFGNLHHRKWIFCRSLLRLRRAARSAAASVHCLHSKRSDNQLRSPAFSDGNQFQHTFE